MESKKYLGVTQELLDKAHQSLIDRCMKGNLPSEIGLVIDKEFGGGDCPRCEEPFARVDVNNNHGKFTYYKPSCTCYPRCSGVHVDATLRSKGIHIKCGNDFLMEFIANNAIRCKSCQRVTEVFRDKAESPKKPDMSKYRR
ncbi:MAG: hypothetical protein Unbinned6201contig1000_30 [Prokaryotic dsDNA virus sp.]|nr:MAG: hypothetical protein Unbinned6201contig1000_30 [Prokaryotic dsDNA virus sp.]|tara:strand:+ start:2024 stop:2446 length:423 start_codon:yes stop_codon:yes gene_type:complete